MNRTLKRALDQWQPNAATRRSRAPPGGGGALQRRPCGLVDFIADALAGPLAEAGAGGVRGALIARALVGAVVQVAKMWAASGYREQRAEVVRSCVLVAVGTLRALQCEQAGPAPGPAQAQ